MGFAPSQKLTSSSALKYNPSDFSVAEELPGVLSPTGFFDPIGFAKDASESENVTEKLSSPTAVLPCSHLLDISLVNLARLLSSVAPSQVLLTTNSGRYQLDSGPSFFCSSPCPRLSALSEDGWNPLYQKTTSNFALITFLVILTSTHWASSLKTPRSSKRCKRRNYNTLVLQCWQQLE